jgi:hypothetical protein
MSSRHSVALAAAAPILLAAVLSFNPISNNDIWLHLTSGRLILERLSVPRVEEYTFTREGASLVDHEWLAQVIFTLFDAEWGPAGLHLLKTAVPVALISLLLVAAVRRARPPAPSGANPWVVPAATLATAAAALMVATHLHLRPHLFTLLMAAVFVLILPRLSLPGGKDDAPDPSAERSRWIAVGLLAALQVLWVNLHGGFVIGIVLAGVPVLAALLSRLAGRSPAAPNRQTLLLPLLLAAASLINPYGWKAYALVGRFGDPVFREFIVEWQSPFAGRFLFSPLFWIYVVWLGLAMAMAVGAFRRGDHSTALLVTLFGLLSVTSRRHVSLFAVVTAPDMARSLAATLSRLRAGAALRAGWIAPGAVLALAAGIAVAGVPWGAGAWRRPGFGIAGSVPAEAVETMRLEGLQGRVFNTMAFGSYVTYAGWPGLRTFIDSRLEIFGGDFLRRFRDAGLRKEAFDLLARETPFDLVLLSWQRQSIAGPLEAMAADPRWALIYWDDLALLYARRSPEREAMIRRREFRAIHPMRFLAGGGFPGGAPIGVLEAEARRAVSDPPVLQGRPAVNATARLLLSAVMQTQGRHAEAAAELKASIAARPDSTLAWGMLGTSLMAVGDRGGAREAFEELRRRVPGSEFADQMLREIEGTGGD